MFYNHKKYSKIKKFNSFETQTICIPYVCKPYARYSEYIYEY